MKTAIHWFRRDLRIRDNTALSEAAKRAECVILIFVVDDAFRAELSAGSARLAFLVRSLASLRDDLAKLGRPLVVRHGQPELVLPGLCRDTGVQVVFANKGYELDGQRGDARVLSALNSAGISFELYKDAVMWEEEEILTRAGRPYTVFTPYAKAWKAKEITKPRPGLGKVRPPRDEVRSDPLPTGVGGLVQSPEQAHWLAGERAGLNTLHEFLCGPVHEYSMARDFPAMEGTSRLSAHLNCGTIGIRTVLAGLKKARAGVTPSQRKSCDVFLTELIWREFFVQILHNFPHVASGAFRPEYDALAWSDNPEHFQAWCAGCTGYPIVDAAMRCLHQAGWMHNRLRMIASMFLTKDLLINWQWGERYFLRLLVDGDMAANNGGWQWSAGTGTDAAPYFRIFNPVSQGEQYDPGGRFVRQWVPELASLPEEIIHRPWVEPAAMRHTKYPRRIVRHEDQRPKCLAMYRAVKRRQKSFTRPPPVPTFPPEKKKKYGSKEEDD